MRSAFVGGCMVSGSGGPGRGCGTRAAPQATAPHRHHAPTGPPWPAVTAACRHHPDGHHPRGHPGLAGSRRPRQPGGAGQLVRLPVRPARHRQLERQLGGGPPGPASQRLRGLGATHRRHHRHSRPTSIVVNLTTEHLTVFKNGKQIDDFPAGIGARRDPTVTGQYFMTMRCRRPTPATALSYWSPRPIRTPSPTGPHRVMPSSPSTARSLPTDDCADRHHRGAAISHGCIRLHDADLAQLAPSRPAPRSTSWPADPSRDGPPAAPSRNRGRQSR